MPGTSDVIYLYDGSFEGLLCCVHESVYTHELPVDIQPEEAAQPTLFRQKYIAADEEKAARVYDSIPRKISPATAEELRYRVLWKRFYKTIAIAARENPRCRMTHCPKRYWENMLEMEDELRRTPDSLEALPAAAPALLPQKEGHYGAQYSFPRLP